MIADLLSWPHLHPHGVEVVIVLALATLVGGLGVLLIRSFRDRLGAATVEKIHREG